MRSFVTQFENHMQKVLLSYKKEHVLKNKRLSSNISLI